MMCTNINSILMIVERLDKSLQCDGEKNIQKVPNQDFFIKELRQLRASENNFERKKGDHSDLSLTELNVAPDDQSVFYQSVSILYIIKCSKTIEACVHKETCTLAHCKV